MTPREFYDAYAEHARRNESECGVPALFTLAQAALETGWGRHCPGHMMFGIKAGPAAGPGAWQGKRQLLVTREVFADARQGRRFPEVIAIRPRPDGRFDYTVRDWFRAYDSPLESFRDHAAMLRANPRYAAAFLTADPREFARRIAAAGYATAPDYAANLVRIIGELEAIARARESARAPAARTDRGAPAPGPRARRPWFAALLSFFLSLFARRA